MKEQTTVYTCDRCKKKTVVNISFDVHVGFQEGGSGSTDKKWETVDLCTDCASIALRKIAHSMKTCEEAQKFVDDIKAK